MRLFRSNQSYQFFFKDEPEDDFGFGTVDNGLLFFILVLKSSVPVSVNHTADPLVAMVNRFSHIRGRGSFELA